jgi:glycerol kinase
MAELVAAIDQGTTSTRFFVFDRDGRIVASAQKEHRQVFPRPGWVEHDPMEIWANTSEVVGAALGSAGLTSRDLAAVGIANQRETVVVWDRRTGSPVANAIVWQDTRTADLCAELSGEADRLRTRTGLPVATYFSGPKIRWLLESEGLEDRAEAGELAAGTVDSWLAWNLTGRHVSDVTNASRTLLFDLASCDWAEDLASAVGVPMQVLPEVVDSVGEVGTCGGLLDGVPLTAILGDQQAALFGQVCFEPGEAKNTYGTGNFMLMNTGHEAVASRAGLLTTVAYRSAGQPAVFALEGSIAVTGSLVQWLRDNLGIIDDTAAVEQLARGVEDNGDVYFVPAFSGLFAPHWRPDARGVIVGLTGYANKGHLARAALEATAYQTRDVLEAMTSDSGVELTELRVDGGMTANDLLMQFQADILGVDVVRPEVTETTALGAAYAAGMAVGVWTGPDEVRNLWREGRRWHSGMSGAERERLVSRWAEAVQRSLGWS